ncbi:phosphoenolpyruvate-dependent sugar phosphotransferase system EIIC [Lacticaseibacillus sharpeae JCM 1186 = DSM 20505]|uniref:Phosphoenolpyruvate-dependent sugar phosphotransferase system EIIC n=2 Tax=Lacticaseibacillus sharpeae TaxID=1626 RepID=A0A0R1ZK75_9LACO|nr:phosphoenolpyruvate-dependent sugar phosphotransferase system EIIC [Lacticaseibacillus sharpeae JCM 1186 = DSM 20505]
MIIDQITVGILCNYPLLIGFVAGIIMGDVKTGLVVGATLQLMVLGVGTYGGASIPDFMTGAIVGTAYAVITGRGIDFAIGLAVPVGLLMVQLDVLARFTNTFFLHRVDRNIEQNNIHGVARNVVLGVLPWGLSRAIPVLVMLIVGNNVVQSIVAAMPQWLTKGLSVAGGILPVVGIAILLRFLPTKRFISYLIIGFFAAAYLKVPMLGVALLGLAMAVIYYTRSGNTTGGSDDSNDKEGHENEIGEYED